MIMDQGETPRSDFPELCGLFHEAYLTTCAGGQEHGIVAQLGCRHQRQTEISP